MFTRAAKSVVKNLGQRKYYGGEDNLKVTVIGAAGEVGQTLSHFVKNATKLESPVIRDCKPNSRLLLTAQQSRSSGTSKTLKVQDPRTESFPQKSQRHSSSFVSCFANRELDLERTVTELREKEIKLWPGYGIKKQTETSNERPVTSFPLSKTKTTGLIGVLGRVPATSTDSAASQSRQVGQTSSYTPITTQGWPMCKRKHMLHEALGRSAQLRWSCGQSVIFFRGTTGSILSATPPVRKVLDERPEPRDEAILDSSRERRIIDGLRNKKPEASSIYAIRGIAEMLRDPFLSSLGFYCGSLNDSFIFTLVKNEELKGSVERSRTQRTTPKREYGCDVLQDSSMCRLKSTLEPLKTASHLPIPYEYSFQRTFKSLAIGMMSICGECVGKVFRTAHWIINKRISFDKPQPADLLRLWKKVDHFVVSSLRSYEEPVAKKDRGNWLAKLTLWRSAKTTDGKIAYLDKMLVASLRKIRLLKNKIEAIERLMERELQTR